MHLRIMVGSIYPFIFSIAIYQMAFMRQALGIQLLTRQELPLVELIFYSHRDSEGNNITSSSSDKCYEEK